MATTADDRAPYIGFRPGATLQATFAERTTEALSPALVAKRDLERYYALLQQSLPTFSVEEASLIVDALNSLMIEPHTARLLWAAVEDAIASHNLTDKWRVDGVELTKRLRALTPFEAMAVADACERARKRLENGEDNPSALRAVGLTR